MRDEETVDHVELRGVLAVEAENDAVPTTSSGSGSAGPPAATRPSSGQRLDERLPPEVRRLARREATAAAASAIRREPSFRVRGDGLAHEGRSPRRPELLESHRPGLELGRGRSARPERGVDREQLAVGNGGQLGGPLEAVGELGAARRPGDRRLQPERGRGGARVVSVSRPSRAAASVTSSSGSPECVSTRSGRRVPSG